MFEPAELGQTLTKRSYEQRLPKLRTALLDIQTDLLAANFPVIVLVSGVDGSGKGEIINTLNEWMDAHHIRTVAFAKPTEEEAERPPHWRYWMGLPPKGITAILVGSWYSDPLSDRMKGRIGEEQLSARLTRINQLEQELCSDGALIVKYWLHLSGAAQKRRLKRLRKDPRTSWRVTRKDLRHLKHYHKFRNVAEQVLRETSSGEAPWLIVDASDPRYRNITVAQHLLDRIRRHLDQRRHKRRRTVTGRPPARRGNRERSLLGSLDLTQHLGKTEYERKLAQHQARLSSLARTAHRRGVSAIIVFEGWDAAGKSSAIRRITRALDARQYRVMRVAAPTDEEAAHHYLWRFWRHLPRGGNFTIYDRSWYGRVLVERIRELASRDEWMRAYMEINEFEEELTDHGIVVIKFWLHIDKDEQWKRFKQREHTSYKRYKITDDDYRNREQWDNYETAVNEMVARTSSSYAPWHLIEANDKRFARIKVLHTLCSALKQGV